MDNYYILLEHVKQWKQAQYKFTKSDLKDLERIYKVKAPKILFEETTTEDV